jgi:hypothetical protein
MRGISHCLASAVNDEGPFGGNGVPMQLARCARVEKHVDAGDPFAHRELVDRRFLCPSTDVISECRRRSLASPRCLLDRGTRPWHQAEAALSFGHTRRRPDCLYRLRLLQARPAERVRWRRARRRPKEHVVPAGCQLLVHSGGKHGVEIESTTSFVVRMAVA